jgi:YD repeat-containing protein
MMPSQLSTQFQTVGIRPTCCRDAQGELAGREDFRTHRYSFAYDSQDSTILRVVTVFLSRSCPRIQGETILFHTASC